MCSTLLCRWCTLCYVLVALYAMLCTTYLYSITLAMLHTYTEVGLLLVGPWLRRCSCTSKTGSVGVLSTVVVQLGVVDCSSVYSNTLTLLNTDLLLSSGVVSVSVVHSMTMKTLVHSNTAILLVVLLGTVFLLVQCCEYMHLY